MLKKILMIVLYSILGIVAIILLVALFTKKDYVIQKEIVIDRPDSTVYEHVRFLNNHKAFNAWLLKDPNIKLTSTNKDGDVGYVLSYEGNKEVGSGKQEIKRLQHNKMVDIELTFLKPFKSVSETPFEFESLGLAQTKVKWTMRGKMNYPMNFALLFINMDNFLGKDVQKSLANLKTNLER